MIFHCPNCESTEVGEISYTERDRIFTHPRDGYGLMLQYALCKNCSYPLAAFVNIKGKDEKEEACVQYYKDVITCYQNGSYAKKEELLKVIRSRYEKAVEIVGACDKFLENL